MGEAMVWCDEDCMILAIACSPDEAEVRIDGIYQGHCGLLKDRAGHLRLNAGRHDVEIVAAGYRRYWTRIEARGMMQRLQVALTRQN